MTDLQELYLLLLLIYLSECFFWVRHGTLVLVGQDQGHFVVKFPSPSLGNARGGLVFLGFLPPAGGAFLCRSLPYSAGPRGAAALPALTVGMPGGAPPDPAVIQFDTIKSIDADEEAVQVDGRVFVHCSDAHQAAGHAALLEKLKLRKRSERGKTIDQALARRCDMRRIAARLNEYGRRARWLSLGCHGMFMVLFVMPLATLIRPELATRWPIFLSLLAACDIWIAITFYLTHRKLCPEQVGARWKALAIGLLAPPASVRAVHALSRNVLAAFEPLACAAALCNASAFGSFGRRTLQVLTHPAWRSQNMQANEIRDDFANRLLLALEPALAHAGKTAAQLLAAPTAEDPSCRTYCPRCDTQFTLESGVCKDCDGVVLLPLAVPPSSPDSKQRTAK